MNPNRFLHDTKCLEISKEHLYYRDTSVKVVSNIREHVWYLKEMKGYLKLIIWSYLYRRSK